MGKRRRQKVKRNKGRKDRRIGMGGGGGEEIKGVGRKERKGERGLREEDKRKR